MPNKKKHTKHKKAVRLRRALSSPIKRLPLEILQDIFVQCLPSRNHVLDKNKAPLLLTYICPEWREIAISTSELWSSLHIEIPWRIQSAAAKAAPLHYYIQKAKEWLVRSGIRPLSISLCTREPRMYDSLIELLGPFIHRVQALDLWVNHDFMTRLGPQGVPLLQDVAVHTGSSETIPPFEFESSIFSNWTQTSSVRQVNLDGHVYCGHISVLSLNLQKLELNCIYDAKEILNLLKQCRNLEQFSLYTIVEPIDVELADELITLPNLHTLIMTTLSFTVEALLFRLILPKLRNLIINVSPMEDLALDNDLNSTLSTMITRSSCALSMERFRFPHVAPFDTLVDLIFLMPNLVDLALTGFFTSPTNHNSDNHVGDRFLQRLTPTSTDTLLPNLQRIRLFQYRYIADDTLTDFIYWRMRSFRRGIPQLTMVHIQRWEVYPRVILPEIQFWEDRGLDITVESRRLRRPPIYLPP